MDAAVDAAVAVDEVRVEETSASVYIASSSAARRLASICLFLSTLIASALACLSTLTLIYLILVSILIALLLLMYNHFF